MNEVLRQQILAMARTAGMETYEGFAGSPNILQFQAHEFEQFTAALWQMAFDQGHDLGHDEGYDAGHFAAESSAAFEARNQE